MQSIDFAHCICGPVATTITVNVSKPPSTFNARAETVAERPMLLNPFTDRVFKFRDIMEHASSDALARDLGEEPLDEIDPRAGCWGEVELETLLPGEPALHLLCLVRSAIVDDEMHRGGSSLEYAQLQQYDCTSNNPAQNFWQTNGPDTVMDLNGNWTDGSTRSAHIYEGPSACPQPQCVSIMIDMSAFGRPNANGSTVDPSTITVTFPDDKTYTGQVQPPNTIRWSNGSIWTKN
jgi:hypothetical protein